MGSNVSDFKNRNQCLSAMLLKQIYQYHKLRKRKGAKIRNGYNQVPHLTQDTNGKVTNSQLDTTNESQEVSPFPAGDQVGLKSLLCQGLSEPDFYGDLLTFIYK